MKENFTTNSFKEIHREYACFKSRKTLIYSSVTHNTRDHESNAVGFNSKGKKNTCSNIYGKYYIMH